MSRRMFAFEEDNAGEKSSTEIGRILVPTPARMSETSWDSIETGPDEVGSPSNPRVSTPGPSSNTQLVKVAEEFELSQVMASDALMQVSDPRAEYLTKEQSHELLTTYIIFRFEKDEPHNKYISSGKKANWANCVRRRLPNVDNRMTREQIQRLNKMDKGTNLLEKLQSLDTYAEAQVARVANDLDMEEQDPRYHITLKQLDLTEGFGFINLDKSRKHGSSSKKRLRGKTSITAYFSRQPRPDQNARELYHQFMLNKYRQQEETERRQQGRDVTQIREQKIRDEIIREKLAHPWKTHLDKLLEQDTTSRRYTYPRVDEDTVKSESEPVMSKRNRLKSSSGNRVESSLYKDIQHLGVNDDVREYPNENYDHMDEKNPMSTSTTASPLNLRLAAQELASVALREPRAMSQGPQIQDLNSEDSGATASSFTSGKTSASHFQSFSQMMDQSFTVPNSFPASSSLRWGNNGKEGRLPNTNVQSAMLNEKRGDGEIQSVASLPESIHSTESDDSSLGQAGINYIVAKLTGDNELLALYTEASEKLSEKRFIANNRRLMKGLYLDLCREPVQSVSMKEAAGFLISRRERDNISRDVFRAIIPDTSAEILPRPHERDFPRLDDYLRGRDAAEMNLQMNLDIDLIDDGESEIDDEEGNPALDFTTLRAVGEYLVTSRAFSEYKDRFRRFLHPQLEGRHKVDESHVPGLVSPVAQSAGTRFEDLISGGRDSTIVRFYKWINDAIWQPPKGAQRVWYLCSCERHTYIDVEELRTGGAEAVRREIMQSVAAVRGRAYPAGQGASSSNPPWRPSPPPPAHQHSGRPSHSPSNPPLSGLPSLSNTNATFATPKSTHTKPKFLLVCVEGKSSKTLPELRHLDVSDEQDDENFVRRILEQYEEARKNHHWTMSLLVPAWIRRWQLTAHLRQAWSKIPAGVAQMASCILESPPVSFMSKRWSELASAVGAGLGAPLHILHEADFVRFQLFPHVAGKDPYPSEFEPDRWPSIPIDALTQHRYIYKPRVHAKILTMNLGHMRRHLEALPPQPQPLHTWAAGTRPFWYARVPKKLDEPLFWPPDTDEDVLGYGIRIKEKLNVVLVLCWALVGLVLTGVAVAACAARTGDSSAAFGLGAYLVALLGVYIPLQYEFWKRT